MAENLSPDVYVGKFDSAAKPMEGVETSTAGFIGAAAVKPAEFIIFRLNQKTAESQ